MNCPHCGGALAQKDQFCPFCGKKVDPEAIAAMQRSPEGGAAPFGRGRMTAAALVAALAAVLIAGGMALTVQARHLSQSRQTVASQQEQIAQLDQQLEQVSQQLARQKEETADARQQAKRSQNDYKRTYEKYKDALAETEENRRLVRYFYAIDTFLQSDGAGYASEHFWADQSIIIMKATDPPRLFQIGMDYDRSRVIHVTMQPTTDAAQVGFADETWQDVTTNVSVKPVYPGTTLVTFTNDYCDETFQVLIIVTT